VISIIDCFDDPNVFAGWFKDPATWIAWRAFVKAVFGLQMTADEWSIYKECTSRSDVPIGFDEVWAITGRRGGKSLQMALIGIYLATMRDYRPFLAPGERATLPIIAATRPQARNIFRYLRGALQNVPMLREMVESETADSIDLTNSVTIEVATASYKGMRGYTLLSAICDEVCFWASDEYSRNPDTEVLASIRPGMGSIPGAKLLCVSSPHARRGEAYENYKRYFGVDGADVLIWQASTRRMNPTFKQSTVDREMEKDSAKASAEYLAIWRDDIASYISREVVDGCIDRGVRERPFQAGLKYKAFCDPSGGSSDAFSLAICHMEKDIAVLDCLREIGAPFVPTNAVAELAKTLKSYRLSNVTGDKYAAQWTIDAFRQVGINYLHSALSRSDIYAEALPILNSARIKLLDNPKCVSQICNLERRTGRAGKDSIDHGPGGHDDLANSALGVVTLMTTGRNEVVTMDEMDFRARLNPDNWRTLSDGTRKFEKPINVVPHPTRGLPGFMRN
jgi:hypothetical protein